MKNYFFKRSITISLIISMIVNPAVAAQHEAPQLRQQGYVAPIKIIANKTELAAVSAAEKSLAAGQVIVDPSAQQTGLKTASNGTQVIDIAAPTAGGVSHNIFSEFNVDQQGVIFNNSFTPVLTQLGGWSDGNRRLAGGDANIILNEVTGLARSNLFGQIEVAGKTAEFVLANPNGISCNGCGFINTPRVTMVTGRADVTDGALKGFNVSGGNFSLEGAGVNAANVDRFDIVSRAVQINAQIYAKQLNIYTGANYYDYSTGELHAANATSAPSFQFALDASSLGAMYANSIRLIGTEKGLGVNSEGLIQSVTDLELNVDGNIRIKDAQANNAITMTSSNGDITTTGTIYSQDVSLTAKQNIVNEGVLGAKTALNLNATTFNQKGELYAGLNADTTLASNGDLHINLTDSLVNEGLIYVASQIDLTAETFSNDKGTLVLQSAAELKGANNIQNAGLIKFNGGADALISANRIYNSSGNVFLAGEGTLSLAAIEDFHNAKGTINANNSVLVSAANINNNDGVISAGNIKLDADSVTNSDGTLTANLLAITADSLLNRAGKITALDTDAIALSLTIKRIIDNTAGSIFTNSNALTIATESFINNSGEMVLANSGKLDLQVVNAIENTKGRMQASNINLAAAALNNNQGTLLADQLSLNASTIVNDAGLAQAKVLSVTADQYRSAGGTLLATGATSIAANALTLSVKNSVENTHAAVIEGHGGNLVINANRIVNTNGSSVNLLGGGSLKVAADTLNNQQGNFVSSGDLQLTATALDNYKGQLSGEEMHIASKELQNIQGTIAAKNLTVKTTELNNNAGVISAVQALDLRADRLKNNEGLVHSGGNNFSLNVQQIENTKGQLVHSGSGVFSITGSELHNNNGSIQGNGSLDVQTKNVLNSKGLISALANTTIAASEINNSSGNVIAGSKLSLVADTIDNTAGQLQGKSINLGGQTLINNKGVIAAVADATIAVDNRLENQNGVVNSQARLSISAGQINNNNGVLSGDDLHLLATDFSNIFGLLQGSQIDLTVPELNNTGGTIHAVSQTGTGLNLHVNGELNNTNGKLINNGAQLALNASHIINTGGSIYSSSNINIDTATFANMQGAVISEQALTFKATSDLNNTAGNLMAGNALILDAQRVNNDAGLISAESVNLSADIVDNTRTGIIEASDMTLHAGIFNNEGTLLSTGALQQSLVFDVNIFNNSGRLEAHSENLLFNNVNMTSDAGEIIHLGAGQLHIVSDGSFNNQHGIIATQGVLKLDADSIDNRNGKLIAAKKLDINLVALNNESGVVQSGDGLSLALSDFNNSNGGKLIVGGSTPAHINIAETFNNQQGSVVYNGTDLLTLTANVLDNSLAGLIGGSGAFSIVTHAALNNDLGNIVGGSSVTIASDRLANNNGHIEANSLKVTANSVNNNGVIFSRDTQSESLILAVNNFINTGVLESYGTDFSLNNTNIHNNSGIISHQGSGLFSIAQQQLNNQGGKIIGNADMHIDATGIDNTLAGEILAKQNLLIDTLHLDNSNGVIQAEHLLTVNASTVDNNGVGKIFALGNEAATFTTQTLNNSGVIAANNELIINSARLNNLTGLLQSTQQLSLTADVVVNTGSMLADAISMNALSLENQGQGIIEAGTVKVSGGQLTNAGALLSYDQHTNGEINFSTVQNTGRIESQNAQFTLNSTTLNNQHGQIVQQGNGELLLNASVLQNQQGVISAAATATIAAVSVDNSNEGKIVAANLSLTGTHINNQLGLLQADNRVSVTASSVDNSNSGLLLSLGHTFSTLHIQQFNNQSGTVAINHANFFAGDIDNTQGHILADDLLLSAANINNAQGVIAVTDQGSDDNLQLTISDTLTNNAGYIQASGKNGVINAATLQNTNGQIIHTGTGQLAINTTTLNNTQDSEIRSNNHLSISVSENVTNANSVIQANNSAVVQAAHITNLGGRLMAGQSLVLQADTLTNSSVDNNLLGLISSDWVQLSVQHFTNHIDSRVEAKNLNLSGNVVNNAGLLLSTATTPNAFTLAINQLNNSGVLESKGENFYFNNMDINNTDGRILHSGTGALVVSGSMLNNHNGIIDAAENITLTSEHIDNSLGSIVARRLHTATINTTTLNNSGGLLAANTMNVAAVTLDNSQGEISGDQLSVASTLITNAGGLITATDLSLTAEQLNNSVLNNNNGVINANRLNINAQQLNNQSVIQAEQLRLQGSHLNNDQGLLLSLANQGESLQLEFENSISNAQGTIETHGDNLTINSELNNQQGVVLLTGNGNLTLNNVNNTQGQLLSNGNIKFDASSVNGFVLNQLGLVKAFNNIELVTTDINNTEGTFAAGQRLEIHSNSLNNTAGLLLAKSTADNGLVLDVASPLDNSQGVIETYARNFSLMNPAIINTGGEIRHLGTGVFALNASADFSNDNGILFSLGDMAVDVAGNFINNGQLSAANALQISANNLNNSSTGLLNANHIAIASAATVNQGRLQGNTLNLSGGTFDNSGGELLSLGTADNSLTLDVLSLNNTQGGLIESHSENLTLTTAINNQGGTLLNLGSGALTLHALNNASGSVYAAGNLHLLQQTFANNGGLLQADGNVDLQLGDINNQAGTLRAGNNLQVNATNVDNSLGGKLLGLSGFDLRVSHDLNNHGGQLVTLAENMHISSATLRNTLGQIAHEGEGQLLITGADTLFNNGGEIASNGSLSLSVASIFNNSHLGQAALIKADDLSLAASQLQNNGGQIQADTRLTLTLPNLDNQGGSILALGTGIDALRLNVGAFDNQGGMLEAHTQHLDLSSFALNNEGGVIHHRGTGNFSIINQQDLRNNGGAIQSAGTLNIDGAAIHNQAGLLSATNLHLTASTQIDNSEAGTLAGENLILSANTIKNSRGLIAATGNSATALSLNTPTIFDNSYGTVRSGATNWALQLDQIDNTGGTILHQGTGLLTLSSNSLLTNLGTISSVADMHVSVAGLHNQGNLVADRNLSITSLGQIDNSLGAVIKGGNALLVEGTQSLVNQGEIVSGNQFTVDVTGQLSNTGSFVTDAFNAHLNAAGVNNNGTIAHNGAGTLSIRSSTLNNDTGTLKSAGSLALNVNTLTNGNVISANSLSVTDFGELTNQAAGRMEAENVYFSGGRFTNNGTLTATGRDDSLALYVDHIRNRGSIFTSSFNQSFHGAITNSGTLVHAGNGVLALGDAGDVNIEGGEISSRGIALLSGNLSGAGSLFAQSGITVRGAGTFSNTGSTLYTTGDLLIHSAVNNNFGSMTADGQFTVTTDGAINNNNGFLQGGQVNLQAASLTNQAGTIISTGAGTGSIIADVIDNSLGGTIATANTNFSIVTHQGNINNTQGRIIQQGSGNLILNANSNDIVNAGNGEISVQGNLNVSGHILNNHSGNLTAGTLGINVYNAVNTNGLIAALNNTDSTIVAAQIDNRGGNIAANSRNFTLSAIGLDNSSSGVVNHFGQGTLRLDLLNFSNQAGSRVTSNGSIVLPDSNGFLNFENAGEISGANLVDLHADILTNSGTIGSRFGTVNIHVGGGTLTNAAGGSISATEKVYVAANNLLNAGKIQSDNWVDLQLTSFNTIGDVSADDLLSINVLNSINLGLGEKIASNGELRLTTQRDINNAGIISSRLGTSLTAQNLTNHSAGKVTAGSGDSQLTITNMVLNSGKISSDHNFTLSAYHYQNNGIIAARNNLTISTSGPGDENAFNNLVLGRVISGNDLSISAKNIFNQSTIFSIGNMTLSAFGTVTNSSGRIESLSDMSISTAGSIRNERDTPYYIFGEPVTEVVVGETFNGIDIGGYGWHTPTYTIVTRPQFAVAVGQEAHIGASGNMRLSSGAITNSYGTIYVGGNLDVSGRSLENISLIDKIVTQTTTSTDVVIDCPASFCGYTYLTGPEETVVNGTNVIGTIRAGSITGNLRDRITNIDAGAAPSGGRDDTSVTAASGAGHRGNGASQAGTGVYAIGAGNGTVANTNGQSRVFGGHTQGNGINGNGSNQPIRVVAEAIARNISVVLANGNNYTASELEELLPTATEMTVPLRRGGDASSVRNTQLGASLSQNLGLGIGAINGLDANGIKDAAEQALINQLLGNTALTLTANVSVNGPQLQQNSQLGLVNQVQESSVSLQSGELHSHNSTGQTPVGNGNLVVSGPGTVMDHGQVITVAAQQAQSLHFEPLDATIVEVLPENFNPNQLGGLYVKNTAPSGNVLIETRPEFTDYTNFLGSDYLLGALGYNPDKVVKRLGDAFMENQLIRDALMRDTSTRYVSNSTNDYDQMQLLMNNAVAANQSLNLSVGIALTTAQVAALTQDIMWLVTKTVNGEKVLVPELYLASIDKAALTPGGSIIATRGSIDLWVEQSLDLQGSIHAGDSLSLGTAGDFNQFGKLTSINNLSLFAGKNLLNQGSITSQQVNLIADGNLTNSNTGTVNGHAINLIAKGSITNLNAVTANNALLLNAGDSITNTAGSSLFSGGALNLFAQNDIRNQQGRIEGNDVSLESMLGNIVNRTEFETLQTVDNKGRTQVATLVGPRSTIISHNSLRLDAGKDLDVQGSQFAAANDINFYAGQDILLNAIANTHSSDSSSRKHTRKESSTEFQVVKIKAGGNLSLDAGRDLTAQGTEFIAANNISLITGRDLNLIAVANSSHREDLASRKKVIDTTTKHTLVNLNSGGNTLVRAGQDANLTGINLNAGGDASLSAARDTNISAVIDSDYHYDSVTKKKSFGRSKTTTHETLNEQVLGGVINTGGDLLINAHKNAAGEIVSEQSGKVNLAGIQFDAKGDVAISADDDVNITGMHYETLDYQRSTKKGAFGLSKKDQGAVENDSHLQNARIGAGGNAHFNAGNNLTLAATNVVVNGNVDLQAVDKLLITAGEAVSNSANWNNKSGVFSGGKLYSKSEHKAGEGVTAAQASTMVAGGAITGRVGSGQIIGSDVIGASGVKIVGDNGDIDVLAARSTTQAYSHDKTLSVGMGDLAKGLTRPDQMVKNKDGRATVKIADANFDQVDSKSTSTDMRGSNIESDQDVTLIATAGKVKIEGSNLAADADGNHSGTVGLAGATGVDIVEATNTFESETKETHGSAELSVVVQHQAVEVVKAAIAVDAAKEKLQQAKKDYKAYERNLDGLNTSLTQLEADYANKVPGVRYDDLLELRNLIKDTESDKEWYQAGIALAAVNLTTSITTLVQQTAAAVQSTGTYGFNAGVQLDIDASKSKASENATTAVGSTISGNKIVIQTGTLKADGSLDRAGTATTIQGSHLLATDSINIHTGELNVLNSKDTTERKNETEHGHVTAQMTVYGASGGASISGSFDRSKSSDTTTTVNNSTLFADNIELNTLNDFNLRGGNVHADSELDLTIGGDLNVESQQNRSRSKNTSMGVSGGVSLGGAQGEQTLGKALNGNAFTNNLQGTGNVGSASGVNGGISASNGMSVTKETVLTSLTSGGTADIKVKGNTQITGALIATVDQEGKDTGKLSLDTKTLNFTDLRNINVNTQTSAGVSANFALGGTQPDPSQPTTAKGANGNPLKAQSTQVQYENSQQNDASKTLATLGRGNITVGGTQLEKDGALTDAGKTAPSLIALNRDTENTTKVLWNSQQNQTVDASLDHRLLTTEGRKEVAEDFKRTAIAGKSVIELTDKSVSFLGLGEGETSLIQHLGDNQNYFTATKDFASNPNNKKYVETLANGAASPAEKDLAYTALANSIAAQMGVSPIEAMTLVQDHNNLNTRTYDGTDINQRIEGAFATSPDGKQSSVFVVDDNIVNTSQAVNVLGHEVSHGVDASRNPTAIKTETYESNRESYADLMGAATVDYTNYNFASNGYTALGAANLHTDANKNNVTVPANNAKFNSLDPSSVDYRQLAGKELQFVKENAGDYAKLHNLSEEQARTDLTRQALRMVDAKWAVQEHIVENSDARIYLTSKSKGETFSIITPTGYESTGYFQATEAQYNDSYLLAAGASHVEGRVGSDGLLFDTSEPLIKDRELYGWLTKYATPNGEMLIEEASMSEIGGQIVSDGSVLGNKIATGAGVVWDATTQLTWDKAINGVVSGAESGGEFVWDKVMGSNYGFLSNFASNCAENGVGCVATDSMVDTHGTSGDKAFIDQLMGNRPAYLAHTTGQVYEEVADIIELGLMLSPAGAGRKVMGENVADGAMVIDNVPRVDPTDIRIDLARVRQENMLIDDVGFNISPLAWDNYPTIGRNGSFLSDRQGVMDYFDNSNGNTSISISPYTAMQIETDMGLEPGALLEGFKVRRVTEIQNLNPTSPLKGNDYFLGPGNHLPGGAPEMVVNSISTTDNINVSTVLTVNVEKNIVGKSQEVENLSLLDPKAETHILDGEGKGKGGHRYGTNEPGKTEFPQSWSDQTIKNVVSDIATDPTLQWSVPNKFGYSTTSKMVDGIEVKVVYDTKKGRIVSAYPTNTQKNP